MPTNLSKGNVNTGEIVYTWTVKEYEKYERSRRWYWLMGIVGVSLLVYSIIDANYLFVLIIVLFGIILFLQEVQEPMDVTFAITETGIVMGRKFYSYSELENFWMIYNPPMVKTLYFLTKDLLKHRLQIALFDNDPRPIRDFLSQYLKEDLEQEDEPLSDKMGRTLKLH
ncbi:MAG: hypothetical protein WC526_00955 [Patescibacteria group bacterium]